MGRGTFLRAARCLRRHLEFPRDFLPAAEEAETEPSSMKTGSDPLDDPPVEYERRSKCVPSCLSAHRSAALHGVCHARVLSLWAGGAGGVCIVSVLQSTVNRSPSRRPIELMTTEDLSALTAAFSSKRPRAAADWGRQDERTRRPRLGVFEQLTSSAATGRK